MEGQLTIDHITKILGTCFLLAFGLLSLWFFGFMVAGDFAFRIHANWFSLDRVTFNVMNYYGMAFLKMVAILLFLFPYIALKIVGRNK